MKKVTFTMGAPAAGKSTWIHKNLSGKMHGIDPDLLKARMPGYDPKGKDLVKRDELHEKSKLEANALFAEMLMGDLSFYVDGTGTNFAPLIQKIRAASQAGFVTELVYVTCTISQSLARNALRERTVPESVIREKFDCIEYAFEALSKEADGVRVIDNSADRFSI